MTLNNLYTAQEQEEIKIAVSKINRTRYLTLLADKYLLPCRLRWQISSVQDQSLKLEQIADMKEIARLFSVDRTSVMDYLRKKLGMKYNDYQRLCWQRGRKRGITSLTESGRKHQLTPEDRSLGGKR